MQLLGAIRRPALALLLLLVCLLGWCAGERIYQAGQATDGRGSQGAAELHGFEILDQRDIEEYQANATLYRHIGTGAELLSVHSADENKVFGGSVRTPVSNSHGAPHVLEHSVLSGTQRFPVKELLAELLKGSLATYVNALTYPDKTVYPIASTNLQDIRNLMDVYMDVMLHPLLPDEPRIFEKEGWHYLLHSQGNLSYSGVVMSEMKGVYSSPDSLNGILAQRYLFLNNTYYFDSGGNPTDIPDLTFDETVAFYRRFYHPSNARFWMWGDGPSEDERLSLLASYLDGLGTLEVDSEIALQPLYTEPLHIVEYYPAGTQAHAAASDQQGGLAATAASSSPSSPTTKAFCTLNWVLAPDHFDMLAELAASFLDYLLLGTRAAALHKPLVDSGLGEEVVGAGGGLNLDLRQPTYTVGLKGVDPDRCEEVFDLILSTLARLEAEGFNSTAIEAAVNTIEFQLRENNTGGFPRGLNQFLRALRYWLYGKDPFEPMQWQGPLNELKEALAAGEDIFGPLLTKYFLDNNHRVALSLLPDSSLGEEQEAEERERLDAVREALGEEGLRQLADQDKELQRWQEEPNSPEALAKIPSLQVQDLDPQTPIIPTQLSSASDGMEQQLSHDIPTIGIVYLDLALDLRGVPQELLPLVPLFATALTETGTRNRSFVELTELIGRKTGGVSVQPFVSAYKGEVEDPRAYLMVLAKALGEKGEDMMSILGEVLTEARLDNKERFLQLALENKSSMERDIVEGGNRFANTRLQAQRSVAGWVREQMFGTSQLEFVRALIDRVHSSWEEVLHGLESIRASVLQRDGALINLTADQMLLEDVEPALRRLMDALPSSPRAAATANWSSILPRANEAFTVPTQVGFVCKSADLYRDAHYNVTGSMWVATHYLSTTWLWDRVRVQGNAYGVGCSFDLNSGMFTYCSYRDPNLLPTVKAFDGSVEFLADSNPSNHTLSKSIVGAIADIDPFMLPDAKGYTSLTRHVLGITDAERQQRRDKILATGDEDLVELAAVLAVVAEEGGVAAVTSSSQVAAANQQVPDFFQHVHQVL